MDVERLSADAWLKTRTGNADLEFQEIITLKGRGGFFPSESWASEKGGVAFIGDQRLYLVDADGAVSTTELASAPAGARPTNTSLVTLGTPEAGELVYVRPLSWSDRAVCMGIEVIRPLSDELPVLLTGVSGYPHEFGCVEGADGKLGAFVTGGRDGVHVRSLDGRVTQLLKEPGYVVGNLPGATVLQVGKRVMTLRLDGSWPALTTVFEAPKKVAYLGFGDGWGSHAASARRSRGVIAFVAKTPGEVSERMVVTGSGADVRVESRGTEKTMSRRPLGIGGADGRRVSLKTWGDLVTMSGSGPKAKAYGRSLMCIGAYVGDDESNASAWRIDGWDMELLELSPTLALAWHGPHAWLVRVRER